jgi:hypothetical protein
MGRIRRSDSTQPLQPFPGALSSLIGWITVKQRAAAAFAGGGFNIDR